MSNSGIVLLVLTVISWLLLAAVLSSVVGVVAVGDRDIFLGLRWILAGILIVALWLWLGGLLLIAGGKGATPTWVNLAALVLVPASAAAALAALYLVSETPMRWPLIIPLAIPPLIAGYVLSLYQTSLRSVFAAPVGHLAVWGTVLILSIAVWPGVSRHMQAKAAKNVERSVEMEQWQERDKERRRAENLEKVKAMPLDKPLADWFTLLAPDSGVRAEAIDVVKTVPRRQADVIEALDYGVPAVMRLVPDLDLKLTPELCKAAQTYLETNAKEKRIRNRDPYPYEADVNLDASLPGVSWFIAHGCNCDEGIAALETVVRTYLDSSDRQKLLAALDGLKQAR